MSEAPFRIKSLDAKHRRADFHCGTDALDSYFHTQVNQDMRRRVTACFVALDATDEVAGFYTLASASVLLGDLPEITRKKLPRYPSVPVVRMGRLAVDTRFKGQGLGSALLADALARCIQSEIAAYALLVNAKDSVAATFYEHHGFAPLPGDALCLFLPLATAQKLV